MKRNAASQKTQLLADRAASMLFYVAVAAALIAGAVWTVYFGGVNTQVVAVVVTVLIIACPHALGLAVPLVVANTTALGAKNGILIRDRQAMELAKDLNIITFDKTGTLTKGEIGVVDSNNRSRDISLMRLWPSLLPWRGIPSIPSPVPSGILQMNNSSIYLRSPSSKRSKVVA